MTPEARRAFIEAVKSIPARDRAWLESKDPALYAYHGWGIMLNSAQEESIRDVRTMPPGTIHVWRFANRTGKTTGLGLLHAQSLWEKWRFQVEGLDHWLGYNYRTLHSAPLNVLVGKAWSMIEQWTKGDADQQRNLVTNRQRGGLFVGSGLYTARTGKRPDGSDALWVECANGSFLDFLSTHDGAGRVEGEAWWVISWDEFPRQQPVDSIPILIDQTFLPRSSDREAPIILSGTAVEQADAVYDEIEEKARGSRWFNFKSFGREANFSQTQRSIDRQVEASFDKAAVHRSVHGGMGEGGTGALYPLFVVRNAFDSSIVEEKRTIADLDPLPKGRQWVTMMSVDHAVAKDRTVASVIAAPWPPFDPQNPAERHLLFEHRIEGLELNVLRSSSSMTPDQMEGFVDRVYERVEPMVEIVDATGEGGQMLFRSLRAKGHRVRACNYTERLPGQPISNKEFGQIALAKLLGFGIISEDPDGNIIGIVEPDPGTPFGLFRLPRAGNGFLRLERQLKTITIDQAHMNQDESMTYVQLAWHLWPFYARGPRAKVSPFDIRAPRRVMTRAR
jgi:hypothetical protein